MSGYTDESRVERLALECIDVCGGTDTALRDVVVIIIEARDAGWIEGYAAGSRSEPQSWWQRLLGGKS